MTDNAGQFGNVRLPTAGHKAGQQGAPLLRGGPTVRAVRRGAPGSVSFRTPKRLRKVTLKKETNNDVVATDNRIEGENSENEGA